MAKNQSEEELDGETTEDEAESSEESEESGANTESESEDEESVDSEDEEDDSAADEDEDESEDDDVDHASELDRLRKQKEKLGKKVDKERERRIAAEKQQGIPREEVERIADERAERILKRNQAENLAGRLAKSSAERDLILHHYENSIVPTGDLEEDIASAHALANKKRVKGQQSEFRRSEQSKRKIQNGGADGGQPLRTDKPKRFSQEIIEGAKFAGVTPEQFAKSLEKQS
jgi:hypothetical protein